VQYLLTRCDEASLWGAACMARQPLPGAVKHSLPCCLSVANQPWGAACLVHQIIFYPLLLLAESDIRQWQLALARRGETFTAMLFKRGEASL